MQRLKPDKSALSKNAELLSMGLGADARVSIDKKTHRGRKCEHCGKTEKNGEKLLQCACKVVYYCCKKHQRLNWQDHKECCKGIRKKYAVEKFLQGVSILVYILQKISAA